VLGALHDWTPPLRATLQDRPSIDATDPLSVWASDLVPLPA